MPSYSNPDSKPIRFVPFTQIEDVDQKQWQHLNQLHGDNPFTDYRFLRALEASHSVEPKTGWQPLHLTFWQADKLIAVLPSYLKSHSYGEFVFDWSWADAYQRAGLDYYPKLLTASPLSPVTGSRLLHDNLSKIELQTIVKTVIQWQAKQQFSSWHINFVSDNDKSYFSKRNLIERYDIQFHWHNQNYENFDDFLAHLKPKKRKNILQERRKVKNADWQFKWLTGAEATQQDWKIFYQMYISTFDKKGNWAQLKPEFFSVLAQSMPDNVLLLFAYQDDKPLAGAFFMRSNSHLYGRYWGAFEQTDGLHFETCYYQGIEFAIKQGLNVFEPGAQGQHKLARGFVPIKTYSYHYIANLQFRQAIADSMDFEDRHHRQSLQYYQQHTPYK